MHAIHLPAFEYRRMRWKNEAGWTREILRVPQQEDWDWRVSIAEIDRDCGFSPFPGCQRILVLLHGEGMRLRFDDGYEIGLLPPHARIEFAGEQAPWCTLDQGPTRDFNLIWRRGRVTAALWHRPLVGPMVFLPQAGTQWLIYLAAGSARLRNRDGVDELQTGDSLLLQPEREAPSRAVLEGGGEVLLVRVSPVESGPAGA